MRLSHKNAQRIKEEFIAEYLTSFPDTNCTLHRVENFDSATSDRHKFCIYIVFKECMPHYVLPSTYKGIDIYTLVSDRIKSKPLL